MQRNLYKYSKFNYTQYKKRLNKSNRFAFIILILIVFILSGLALFIKPINKNKTEFYFIELGNFQTFKQANSLAISSQKEGCAGYIFYSDNFYVLACFYPKYNQAKKVLKTITHHYPNSKIFTLNINKFTNKKTLTKNQNNAIKNLSNFLLETISNLNKISISFDRQEITQTQISTTLSNIIYQFKELTNSFNCQFKRASKYNTSKETLLGIETNLLNIKNLPITGQILKYQIIDIIINYQSFLSSF